MKKRSAQRKVKRTTASGKSHFLHPFELTFRKVVVISTLSVLLLTVFIAFSNDSLTKSVAGISIARPLFSEAVVYLEPVEGASTYNIYYKKTGEPDFTNSVSSIPENVSYYTISYLRKGVDYEYRISAADASGKEFWWSGTNEISDLRPM